MSRVPIPLGKSFGKGRSLTQARLKELLHYDPETGKFTWRPRSDDQHFTARWAGKPAGSINKSLNRVIINVECGRYYAHVLAWLYVTGAWPKRLVDHRDLDATNNRWLNLREATKSNNAANSKRRQDNTSGFKGVSRISATGKFHAYINLDGRRQNIGHFDTAEAAHAAYCGEATKCFGEFANFGRD